MKAHRRVTEVVNAMAAHMPGLSTWRAFPQPRLDMLDPFLFLNHHGPEHFYANNEGLPFGPHPHRGFETLTFIFSGDVAHRDSTGRESVIETGGVQWMTAGSGIVHEEVSSARFKREGGEVEVIQLWMNLPASLKMTAPSYTGLQTENIPVVIAEEGVGLKLISGEFQGVSGPIRSLTGLFCSVLELAPGAHFSYSVSASREVLFYMVSGELELNGEVVSTRQTARLQSEGELIEVVAHSRARAIFCHGEPLKEQVVSYGPFVMNTEAEIDEAIRDYQSGKFGILQHS